MVCLAFTPDEIIRTTVLYLLGLRFGRTFASPFLRGIARDAEYVARRIARARAMGHRDMKRV